jgi:predicted nucleotidyltransferase
MDDAFLKNAIDRIVASYAPEKIFLFGSRAKGEATAASDIDLLIVKETTVPRSRRGRNVQALLVNSPIKFDLLFYTAAEMEAERIRPFSFMARVLQSARVIYPRPAVSATDARQ